MNAKPYRRRSLFWPILLIGAGAFWLLSNLGLVSTANLGLVVSLWPLLLIAMGLDLLFGHRFPIVGALIGLGTVALAAALVLAGPRLGLKTNPLWWGTAETVKTETFSEPVGPATSASVALELESAPTTLAALSDSNALLSATLTHTGQINFTTTGSASKTLRLRQQAHYFGPRFWPQADPKLQWDIGLTSRIPLAVKIDGGSGLATLDLTGLQLSALTVDAGSGDMQLNLPAGKAHYTAQLTAGSGSLNVTVPPEANAGLDLQASSGTARLTLDNAASADLQIAGGSGNVEVQVPAQAAMRVEVRQRGSGSVHLPAALTPVSGSQSQASEWQTVGYDQATRRITLIITRVGSGNIEIH